MSTRMPWFQSYFLAFFCVSLYWPNKPSAKKGLVTNLMRRFTSHKIGYVGNFTGAECVGATNIPSNIPLNNGHCYYCDVTHNFTTHSISEHANSAWHVSTATLCCTWIRNRYVGTHHKLRSVVTYLYDPDGQAKFLTARLTVWYHRVFIFFLVVYLHSYARVTASSPPIKSCSAPPIAGK